MLRPSRAGEFVIVSFVDECSLLYLCKVFTYNLACRTLHLHAPRCAVQRGLAAKIGAPHEGKFFLHMIPHPVAFF